MAQSYARSVHVPFVRALEYNVFFFFPCRIPLSALVLGGGGMDCVTIDALTKSQSHRVSRRGEKKNVLKRNASIYEACVGLEYYCRARERERERERERVIPPIHIFKLLDPRFGSLPERMG